MIPSIAPALMSPNQKPKNPFVDASSLHESLAAHQKCTSVSRWNSDEADTIRTITTPKVDDLPALSSPRQIVKHHKRKSCRRSQSMNMVSTSWSSLREPPPPRNLLRRRATMDCTPSVPARMMSPVVAKQRLSSAFLRENLKSPKEIPANSAPPSRNVSMTIADGLFLKSALSQVEGRSSTVAPSNRRHTSSGKQIRVRLPGEKKKIKRDRTIRFEKRKNQTYEIESQLSLVDDDKRLLWFQPDELSERKSRIRLALRHAHDIHQSTSMDESSCGEDLNDSLTCLRGIEHHMEDEAQKINHIMSELYENILTTQYIQRKGGIYDSHQLAAFSERLTEESRKKAVERALVDALEVATDTKKKVGDNTEDEEDTDGMSQQFAHKLRL